MPIMKPTNWKMAAVTTLAAAGLFIACRREPAPQPPQPQIEYIHTVPIPTEKFSQKELKRTCPVSYNVLARHLRSADVLLFTDAHNVPERAEAMGRIMPLLKRMGFPNMVMGDLWTELQPVLDEFNKTGQLSHALANSLVFLIEYLGKRSCRPERSNRGAIWGVLKSAQEARLRLISPGRGWTKKEKSCIEGYRAYISDVNSMVASKVISMYQDSVHKKSAVFIGQDHVIGIKEILQKAGLRVLVVRLATSDDYGMGDEVSQSGLAEMEDRRLYNGYCGHLDSLARGLELDPKFGKLIFWPVPERLTDRPVDAVIYNPSLNWDLEKYFEELRAARGGHGG
jgi:hypothetical protein